MIKRLYRTAIISSPLIAAIASLPLYVIEKLQMEKIAILWLFLTFIILLFWIVNIYIISKINNPNSYKRYLVSYAAIIFIQAFNIFLIISLHIKEGDNILFPFIPAMGINTIILILSNSIIFQFQKESAEIEVEQLKVKNLEAQKQMLLQQLQPHFLFNALSTLKSLIDENPSLATDYTVRLSDFLRYSVQAKDNEVISLAEELKFTKDYIELQKVRFGDSLACKIEVSETFLTKKVPVYALQTLVENAIKHNAFSDKKPLTIHISTEENQIKVVNNRLAKRLNSPSGTGLQNLNQRYLMIANTEINIEETDAHFIVTLTLV
jgi:two-component system, LytTR family, sensor kinase